MPVKIFFCYAHEDEQLLNKLKNHLSPLKRTGLIETWHDRDISAGTDWERQIQSHLNQAQIILLLVSPDFMASDYSYGIEMRRALERNDLGEAELSLSFFDLSTGKAFLANYRLFQLMADQ